MNKWILTHCSSVIWSLQIEDSMGLSCTHLLIQTFSSHSHRWTVSVMQKFSLSSSFFSFQSLSDFARKENVTLSNRMQLLCLWKHASLNAAKCKRIRQQIPVFCYVTSRKQEVKLIGENQCFPYNELCCSSVVSGNATVKVIKDGNGQTMQCTGVDVMSRSCRLRRSVCICLLS